MSLAFLGLASLLVGCGGASKKDAASPLQSAERNAAQVFVPASVRDVVEANLAKVGGQTLWQKVKGLRQETELQVSLNGQVTVQSVERLEYDLDDQRWRLSSFSGETLDRFTVGNRNRSAAYKCFEGKIVGSTEIESVAPAFNTELNLLDSLDTWTFETFVWKNQSYWSLVSQDGSQRRLYDPSTSLLAATLDTTSYGNSETTYADYRLVNQLLVPHLISTIIPESSYKLDKKITKLEIDPQFDDQLFVFRDDWQKVKAGMQVPEFDLPDFFDPSKRWSRSTTSGKVLLIDFWATWCQPCIAEFPGLRKIIQDNSHPDLIVLAISLDSDEQQFIEFVKRNIPDWYHALVTDGFESTIARQFEIASIPRTILVDPSGTIVGVDDEVRGQLLDQKLKQLLRRE